MRVSWVSRNISRSIAGCALGVALFVVAGIPTRSGNAAGGSMALSPSAKSIAVSTTFTVNCSISTGGQPINAAEATIRFPTDILELQSVSKGGSIFSLWATEPAGSNSSGTITFAGGLPNPGYTGSGGRVIGMVFRTKSPGTAKLTITGAQLLANDGQGTNILTGVGSATYTITAAQPQPQPQPQPALAAPTIISSSHPDETAWSANRNIVAAWKGGTGALGYAAVFDQTGGTIPSTMSSNSEVSFSRNDLSDGIWYLHVRARYADGWSATTTHTFRIDGTAPRPFLINVTHAKETDRTVTLDFATTDVASGIDRYELKVDEKSFYSAISPVSIGDLIPGTHTFVVRAFDKAGNITEAKGSVEVVGPQAPAAFLVDLSDAIVNPSAELNIKAGDPIRLHGFAPANVKIRIVIRSTESVFEFPIEQITDPNPIEPAPLGMTAWKVELRPDLSPGAHEIHVTTVSENGIESAEAPVLRFHVLTNVVRVGTILVSYRLIIGILVLLVLLFLAVAALFFILWLRLRRKTKRLSRRHS